MNHDQVNRYIDIIDKHNFYSSGENLRFYCDYIFDSVSVDGKHILDIGGGKGLLSFWAASHNADSVICLEPELDGSSHGYIDTFNSIQKITGFHHVKLIQKRLQEYVVENESFDIVFLQNSINHLDESNCIKLCTDDNARSSYLRLFEKISALIKSSGVVIVTDCGRRNFFGDIHIPNPFCPTINWELHQQPTLWASLLQKAGFRNPVLRWIPPSRFKHIGKILLANMYASYLLNSHFCLRMVKP